MRLFLAINFPEGVKNALSSGMTALARRGVRANWSRRENLHLTLEFLLSLIHISEPTRRS